MERVRERAKTEVAAPPTLVTMHRMSMARKSTLRIE
jgi:hypothetical protein